VVTTRTTKFPPKKSYLLPTQFIHVLCVDFRTNSDYFPIQPYALHALPILFFSIYHRNNIWWGVPIIQLLIIQLSLIPCYLVLLRTKYFPPHRILKHLQPTFLLQCKRPRFTPIQNNRQNYISLFLALILIIYIKFLPYKLMHKLHMSINVRLPWRWPTSMVETCRSIDEQIQKALCYELVVNFMFAINMW
jgi:hypothetical protein